MQSEMNMLFDKLTANYPVTAVTEAGSPKTNSRKERKAASKLHLGRTRGKQHPAFKQELENNQSSKLVGKGNFLSWRLMKSHGGIS